MKNISVRVPDDLYGKLVSFCRKKGCSRSDVIRAALSSYFLSLGKAFASSCADLASDLIGSAAGPRELATNPKHLRPYGRWNRG